eukprot:m51a1_g11358 hypothetical protein (1370) ;mRNA; r:14167-20674
MSAVKWALFGDPLSDVLEREGRPPASVPAIVESCLAVLSAPGADLSGIFDRKEQPGDKERLNELALACRRAHRERKPPALAGVSPAEALMLLRFYLSKAPDPLVVPPSRASLLFSIADKENADDRRKAFMAAAVGLPPGSWAVLHVLVAFFRKAVTAPAPAKASAQSICKYWARALGKPRTTEELQAVAKILVVAIKGGIPKDQAAAKAQFEMSATAPAAGSDLQLAKQAREIKELREALAAKTKALEAKDAKIASLEAKLGTTTEEKAQLEKAFNEEQSLRRRYWNEMEDMKGKIRVFCRCRPPNKDEAKAGEKVVVSFPDEMSIDITSSRGLSSHQFDRVFTPQTTQEDVFRETQNLVQSAIDGYNVSIFAYGQTGGGKTHTLTGYADQPGVMPRTTRLLFELLSRNKNATAEVTMSVLELYNDTVVDLLSDKAAGRPTIQMISNSSVSIKNVEMKSVRTREEIEKWWQQGCNARHVSATLMNEHSSRSHLLVTINVKTTQNQTREVTQGKLILVDLAGSERLDRSGATGDRQKEAMHINASLTALGDVISALAKGEKHIPYRNNKLTMLMADCLAAAPQAQEKPKTSSEQPPQPSEAKKLNFGALSKHSATKNLRETTKELEEKSQIEREKSEKAGEVKGAAAGVSLFVSLQEAHKLRPTGKNESVSPSKSPSSESQPLSPVATQQPLNHKKGNSLPPSQRHRLSNTLSASDVEKVVDSTTNRDKLIQVKGRRRVKSRVVAMSWQSLNEGDVFILDRGDRLFLWMGSKSNKIEQAKALDVCTRIKMKDRMTRAQLIQLSEGTDDAEWWRMLGGKHPVQPESAGGEDDVEGADIDDILYKIEDKGGNVEATEVARNAAVVKEVLDTFCCYILDCLTEMYVWQGTRAPPPIRKSALPMAAEILRARERPDWVKILKINEGMETVMFKEKFHNWPDTLMISGPQPIKALCSRVEMEFDTPKMLAPATPAKEFMPDDGNGQITKMLHMKEFASEEVPPEFHGQFFSGDSYVFIYTYKERWRDCFVVFYWQGRDSTVTDKGTSAAVTIDVAKVADDAKHVRVVQNQEPKHFMMVMRNKYIVHRGPFNMECQPNGDIQMYHVSNAHSHDTAYPIEIVPEACALDSNDSFIVQNARLQFVWHGSGASPDIRTVAESRATRIKGGRAQQVIKEGAETEEFWKILGGRAEYATRERGPLRLFHCSNSTGKFEARELLNYCQDELVVDDMMVLDASDRVYVWDGRTANEDERKKTFEVAKEYGELVAAKRGTEVPVLVVRAGKEPVEFRACFHGWDSRKTKCEGEELQTVDEVLALYSKTYTLEELKKKPKHLDQTCLEVYLTDEDFRKHFGMNKDEFDKQLTWKKDNAKRALGLY